MLIIQDIYVKLNSFHVILVADYFTGSYVPTGVRGLHLIIRLIDIIEPLVEPYLSSACLLYSEHDGVKRHWLDPGKSLPKSP